MHFSNKISNLCCLCHHHRAWFPTTIKVIGGTRRNFPPLWLVFLVFFAFLQTLEKSDDFIEGQKTKKLMPSSVLLDVDEKQVLERVVTSARFRGEMVVVPILVAFTLLLAHSSILSLCLVRHTIGCFGGISTNGL